MQTFQEFWSGVDGPLRAAVIDRGFHDGDVELIAGAVRRRCEEMPTGVNLVITIETMKEVGDQIERHVHEVLSFFLSKVLDVECENHILRNRLSSEMKREFIQ